MIYLTIESVPRRHYYRDVRMLPYLPVSEARHALLQSVSELRSVGNGENANMSVGLSNADSEASALFVDPPLGAQATVRDETGAVLFTGIVQGVTLVDEAVVELEA